MSEHERSTPRPSRWVTAVLAAGVLVMAGTAGTAAAQDAGAVPGSQGPMVVEQVHDGFAFAPDFKVTTVDDTTARLVGAYGGWLIDNTILIGGGGYWLTNGSGSLEMGYGGAVVEWLERTDRPIGFGARGLVGLGDATLGETVTFVDGRRRGSGATSTHEARFLVRRQFFIAEPQVNVLVNLTRRIRFNAGVGYRFIGGTDGFDDRLRGPTGSIALQFGGSSRTRPTAP